MSDEKTNNSESVPPRAPEESSGGEGISIPEFVFDRSKGEVSIIGPDGKTVAMRARVIDEDEEEEQPREPLSPDEFREALQSVDKLGLTWTADLVPSLKAKTPETEPAFASEELESIQDKYPDLPFEIHLATSYALTGNKAFADAAGGMESLEKKAQIVSEILVDNQYRTEFFFKYAIKVPYLKDIDWEIVLKAYERGITRPLGIPYGLLTLTLQEPYFGNRKGQNVRRTTVAINIALVDELLTILNEVKRNLESANHLRDRLVEGHLLEEQDNAKPTPQLEQ